MTIIYVPSGESKEVEVEKISDVIKVTDTFNSAEQNQYKSFKFCNMTKDEEWVVRRKYLHGISMTIGVPIKDLGHISHTKENIYIPEIGTIYLR